MSFPTVSAEQMREVDRMMVEDLGIQLLQMMENAGRALAHRARVMLGGEAVGRRVTVLAGSGGNGGGGLVAGRRLALWGASGLLAVFSGRFRRNVATTHNRRRSYA